MVEDQVGCNIPTLHQLNKLRRQENWPTIQVSNNRGLQVGDVNPSLSQPDNAEGRDKTSKLSRANVKVITFVLLSQNTVILAPERLPKLLRKASPLRALRQHNNGPERNLLAKLGRVPYPRPHRPVEKNALHPHAQPDQEIELAVRGGAVVLLAPRAPRLGVQHRGATAQDDGVLRVEVGGDGGAQAAGGAGEVESLGFAVDFVAGLEVVEVGGRDHEDGVHEIFVLRALVERWPQECRVAYVQRDGGNPRPCGA